MSQKEAILLLGSNLGDTKKNIENAIDLINSEINKVTHQSKYLETLPVEFVSSNNFCNIAVSIQTDDSPLSLLRKIKAIERKMGRDIDSKQAGEYQDRMIDIDIVKIGALNFISKDLEIPHHKHCFERDFSKELIEDLISKM
ncbi:2-amino-4-hydroxy-6-hydroxymethyldihydropteridine diphosphokinase [Riemerella columbina]|uniref:2-amino-4-hydroxy-6- hydroxymethyldihydropteridine diphosphokinase n=1 Tax=Riemerella columbina TaxID=103810 RepID=UPI00266EAF54|nr:2-amino-4-hydroxy-6-hydroxymethyldihydropteridine diphosphokinase [Riemerella columbina]WKS94604.1 2-amino-4-hydroxy-6-hydroxymethyldihydropteridine diphosphokinase [Riemerella columbina]